MVRTLLLLLCFLPGLASGEVEVEVTPLYSLHLGGDWKQKGVLREENQYCLISMANEAQLSISGIQNKYGVKPGMFDRLVEGMMKLVLDREARVHSQGRGTIERQWTSPIAGGMQLNYEGHDATGRAFRYTGLVFEQKVISVYLEMPVRSAANRAALMDAVIQRVKY